VLELCTCDRGAEVAALGDQRRREELPDARHAAEPTGHRLAGGARRRDRSARAIQEDRRDARTEQKKCAWALLGGHPCSARSVHAGLKGRPTHTGRQAAAEATAAAVAGKRPPSRRGVSGGGGIKEYGEYGNLENIGIWRT